MKITNTKLVTAALLAGVALIATQASATSIPAAMGHPQVGSEQSNFNATDLGITNTNASPKWYEIGAPIDNSGAKTVQVNGDTTMQCFYVQVSALGSGVVVGTSGTMTAMTHGFTTALNGVAVGNGDLVKVECRLPHNATWNGIQVIP